jgi:hypothetical protein
MLLEAITPPLPTKNKTDTTAAYTFKLEMKLASLNTVPLNVIWRYNFKENETVEKAILHNVK